MSELREKIAKWFAENYPPEIEPRNDWDYESMCESYLSDADAILSLMREEGVDLDAQTKLLNLSEALRADANQEIAELTALLQEAQGHVCSMNCRSYFPAGHVKSDADHIDLCRRISAALLNALENASRESRT